MRDPADYPREINPLEPLSIVRYKPETGEILESGTMQRFIYDSAVDAGEFILLSDGLFGLHYVDLKTKEVKARLPNPSVLDGMVIKNVPNPSMVRIEDVDYPCTDGTAELAFSQAGTYVVTVSSVSYLPIDFRVTV